MAAIEIALIEDLGAGPWPAAARAALSWLAACGAERRDAVVLLPFSALLAPARAAFAAAGGWLPRIETPLTLAAALAPPPAPAVGRLCGDGVLDRLHAAALLRRQSWGAARERTDARAFAGLVDAFVAAARSLCDGALVRPPAQRAAFWAQAREHCPPAAGPGAFESLLLRAAIEWASDGAATATDALFDHRAGAWIVVRVGGADALAESVAGAAGVPALLIDLDTLPAAPAAPQRWCCEAMEDEAEAAVAEVIAALDAGRVPVALVALDRVLVRRARALLERQRVALADETGWTLSTTHAAATLMGLLRAAVPGAGEDTRLAWLKTWPPALAAPLALQSVEAQWRGARPRAAAAAARLLARADAFLQPLGTQRERPLAGWLDLLEERLAADGTLARLRADAAGAQMLQALTLPLAGAAGREAAASTRLGLAGFTAWVDATLEAAQFVPPAGAAAEVVLTPLARAIGRPFGHVVVPGADASHLGAGESAASLLPTAFALELGLENAETRRRRQRAAFAQLLRAPAVTLLRRRRDGDEPLAPSPEVEWQALAQAAAGGAWPPERPWQPQQRRVALRPAPRPAPSAPGHLPAELSASTIGTLRDCPYRFFARAVLRLYEADEIDARLDKRDYGTWLHAVLHRFHRGRRPDQDDGTALGAAADAETVASGLSAADLLPFRAGFDAFVPAYLRWLATRDAEGWQWHEGETSRRVEPPALAPQRLAGRIDRIDVARDGQLQVIDYKTGDVAKLRASVKEPLEDTQLAFYAALDPALHSALYLALDDPKAPLEIEHPQVADTAIVFVDQVAGEMARLRAGAALPALGEGRVCENCEARGLCRRDHWDGT